MSLLNLGYQKNGRQVHVSHESRVYGCWLGKSIGGTLGLPAEGKMERLNFEFYDPIPVIAPSNDDLELQLVWLDLVEKGGSVLNQCDFAGAWVRHIHYMWDEYGRCRWNLRRGVPVEWVGDFENWFHAGMGSPIRSEIWACLFPDDPASAGYYAALDASIDHGTEGIAGEVFLAVMQSRVAASASLLDAAAFALAHIPSSIELAQAVKLVMKNYRQGMETWENWREILEKHGHENFTHAPLNIALTLWALLHGDGDFEKSILLAVNGGYDTDCTAATVGATLGLMLGAEEIPDRWRRPIGDDVYVGPGIRDIDAPKTLVELTSRTMQLCGKLEPKTWGDCSWRTKETSHPVFSSLRGSITIETLESHIPVLWANGELPVEVKRAGGAEWEWDVRHGDVRQVVCLARAGAKLFLDDQLILECPAGLPYVPATHRCAPESVILLTPGVGKHRVRVELAARNEDHPATILLAYPNFHIAPWTAEELPHAAIL